MTLLDFQLRSWDVWMSMFILIHQFCNSWLLWKTCRVCGCWRVVGVHLPVRYKLCSAPGVEMQYPKTRGSDPLILFAYITICYTGVQCSIHILIARINVRHYCSSSIELLKTSILKLLNPIGRPIKRMCFIPKWIYGIFRKIQSHSPLHDIFIKITNYLVYL